MIKQKFINVLCIGDCEVGKSTTLRKICEDKLYDPHRYYPTIGLETLHFKTVCNGMKVSFNVWDVSGNRRFRSVALGFLRRCPVVLIFFDTTNVESFKNIDNWRNWVKCTTSKTIKFFLIGIKKKNRIYNYDNGRDYASENDMEYYEMSAFDLPNSVFAMNSIVKSCMDDENIEMYEKANISSVSESYSGCPCM
jgi:small GTP-binding protein